jgi:hypothetical protein
MAKWRDEKGGASSTNPWAGKEQQRLAPTIGHAA